MRWLANINQWLQGLTLFVILDGRDNSVTFSRGLWRRIRPHLSDRADILGYKAGDVYGFALNPTLDKERDNAIAQVQYNAKHRCIGYESLVPTLARIFTDYGIPIGCRVRLHVIPRDTEAELAFDFRRPTARRLRRMRGTGDIDGLYVPAERQVMQTE